MKTPVEIFKAIEVDPIGQMLGTRMLRFSARCGIEGLMRENGHGMIEVLAVTTRTPGRGQFRTFIRQLQVHYQIICVWHIDNPFLPGALQRYGFMPEVTVDEFGDAVTGMRWESVPAGVDEVSAPAALGVGLADQGQPGGKTSTAEGRPEVGPAGVVRPVE
jgi:hypothetical protein